MCLTNPYYMVPPQEKAQRVSWFIETKSDVQTQRRYRLNMETIYHQSLQFVDSKGNLWTLVSVECSEKWGTKNICGKHRECKTIVQSFSYEAYPYCCQRIGTTTYNSAQGSAKKVTIACLRNENVTDFSQMTSQTEKS